jgi:tetratricopeptide (TPR) repeat protein
LVAQETQNTRFTFAWGAALGVGLVLLVGLGWMLAGRAATGGSAAPPPPPPAVSGGAAGEASPHTGAELEVTRDPEIERLRGDLIASPERLDLRKRLALELLRREQFYAAFDEAARILEQAPDDIDGLFVTAAIRIRMGQPSRALPLLERVLEQAPDHVPALTAKGQALLKGGHTETAIAVWKRALELSGGRNAQVEELLGAVEAGASNPHPPVGG